MVDVVNIRTCSPKFGTQEGDVRIDRATKWGNPYPITDVDSRADVLFRYAFYLRATIERGELDIAEIANANRLGCWCKPLLCHGDILKAAIDDYNGGVRNG